MNYEKFSAENAAMLMIDHQVGTMSWVKSIPLDELKRNALLLAQTARILKLPVVLTSSMEDHAQGPLLSSGRSCRMRSLRASSASASSTPWTTKISRLPSGLPVARS